MSLKQKVQIQNFEKIVPAMIFCILALLFISSPLLAVESNESLLTRLQAYANSVDSRFATYTKNIYGINHIKIGYNFTADPVSILDIRTQRAYTDAQISSAGAGRAAMLATPPPPSLRLTHASNVNAPSFAHYQIPGHWIIQSSSLTKGIVFLQPRGGAVQIGSQVVGLSNEYNKKLNAESVTSFNIYAEISRFYKNVSIHNPSAPETTMDLYSALSFVQQGGNLKATEYIDLDNSEFRFNPSSNSVLHAISLSSITDRQTGPAPGNLTYKLDLNAKTTLRDLDITNSLVLVQPNLQLAAGINSFVFQIETGTLVINSTDTVPSGSKIQINRTFVANSADPKKLDINNISGPSDTDGIYFQGKVVLAANGSDSSLYFNSRNHYNRVQIGDISTSLAYVNVHGTVTATKEFIGRGTVPKGGIIFWTGTDIPDGWALCDGQTYYGVATPDLRSRFIVGANKDSLGAPIGGSSGGSYSVGNTGGANSVALTKSQLPNHQHYISDRGRIYWHKTDSDGSGDGNDGVLYNNYEDTSATGGNSSGGTDAHENRPPFYALAFIIRVK